MTVIPVLDDKILFLFLVLSSFTEALLLIGFICLVDNLSADAFYIFRKTAQTGGIARFYGPAAQRQVDKIAASWSGSVRAGRFVKMVSSEVAKIEATYWSEAQS